MTSRTKRVLAGTATTCVALLAPAVAQAAPAWTAGSKLTDSTKMAGSRGDVAVDPSGNALAVWTETGSGDYKVKASYRSAGGSWGPEETVVSSASAISFGRDRPWQRVRFLPSGAALVLVRVGSELQSIERSTGGSWGSAQTISANNGDSPELAVTPQGEVVAAWVESNSVWAARRASTASSFATPVKIADTDNFRVPAMGVDATGLATIAFRNGNELMATTWDGVLPAATPVKLGDDERPSLPSVAVAANGAAVVGWTRQLRSGNMTSSARASYRPSGSSTFGDAATIPSPGAEFAENVRVGIDSSGAASAIWAVSARAGNFSDRSRIETSERPASGAWAAASTVLDSRPAGDSPDTVDIYPQISVAPGGTAVASWDYNDETGAASNQSTVSLRTNGAWAKQTLATVAGGSPQETNPVATVGSDGTVAALWQQGTSSVARSPYAATYEAKPAVTFSVGSLDFGTLGPADASSAAQPVTVTNSGSAPLTISSVNVPGAFRTTAGKTEARCTTTLQPTESCEMAIEFAPRDPGSYESSLTLVDNAPGSPHKLTMKGVKGADVTLPQIQLVRPADGAHYAQGESVTASYTCTDDIGVKSCTGSKVSGALIDTTTAGPRSFTVTAKDQADNVATATVTYTVDAGTPPPVDAAPQITFVRPQSGQRFTQGEAVTASYACTDDKPGVTCVGTVPNGSPLDTSTTGVKSFTVTAKDSASRTTTTTVGYFVDPRPVQTPTSGSPSQSPKSTTPTTPTTSTPVVVAGKQLPSEVKQQAKPVFDAVKSVPNTSTGSQLAKGISTPLLLPPNSSAGSGLIARDGGGLIARDGAGLIARDGGGLIARDGGGLIARDGAGLIARDGAGVISNLGGTALTGSVRGTGSALASTSASVSAKKKAKAKLLVLATTRKTTKAGGRVTLKLKLSARGRKLVKRAFAPKGRQKVKLVMAVGMARPGTGLPAVIVVKPMTIKE